MVAQDAAMRISEFDVVASQCAQIAARDSCEALAAQRPQADRSRNVDVAFDQLPPRELHDDLAECVVECQLVREGGVVEGQIAWPQDRCAVALADSADSGGLETHEAVVALAVEDPGDDLAVGHHRGDLHVPERCDIDGAGEEAVAYRVGLKPDVDPADHLAPVLESV